MQPNERKTFILNELHETGKVEIDALAAALNVSTMTIRRDLTLLEEAGEVIRTHGGAILGRALVQESSFVEKGQVQYKEKRMIATEAVKLIKDHSVILLDSGTTTIEIAKQLKSKSGLTVITNDIHIAQVLMDTNCEVMMTGGVLQGETGTLLGPLVEQTIRDIHVDQLFLGAHGIDITSGITAPTHEKASIKQTMIAAADRTWLVADTSKLRQKSFTKVCGFEKLTGMITDEHMNETERKQYEKKLTIIFAKEGEV